MSKYSFGKTVDGGFDQTIERVTQALAKEGFGILSDIDVAGTLKKKLGLEVPPYRILGACNPQFAHKALEAEPQIGTLLPCNVVVRQHGGKTVVDIMDPLAVMQLVGKPEVEKIATEVRGRLDRVLGAL
ncbi:MAG: ABC transporter ATP-binding protein [Betaproteobacteria bacterium RIFCSPLOWO2_12_FULL_65_14]|nr:MAG: ABC transporter ATP-binding protein [Betaproteobacteria bacterium RIFCSPLOWO2_12_FULL_65_14]